MFKINMIDAKPKKIKIEEDAIAKGGGCEMLFHVGRRLFETGTA